MSTNICKLCSLIKQFSSQIEGKIWVTTADLYPVLITFTLRITYVSFSKRCSYINALKYTSWFEHLFRLEMLEWVTAITQKADVDYVVITHQAFTKHTQWVCSVCGFLFPILNPTEYKRTDHTCLLLITQLKAYITICDNTSTYAVSYAWISSKGDLAKFEGWIQRASHRTPSHTIWRSSNSLENLFSHHRHVRVG